jgi:hypothetical protein
MRQHGFDNPGKLPQHVAKKKPPKKKSKSKKVRRKKHGT